MTVPHWGPQVDFKAQTVGVTFSDDAGQPYALDLSLFAAVAPERCSHSVERGAALAFEDQSWGREERGKG